MVARAGAEGGAWAGAWAWAGAGTGAGTGAGVHIEKVGSNNISKKQKVFIYIIFVNF